MQLDNRTPFVPLSFQSLDLDDEPYQVVVVKGTFDVAPGAALVVSGEQEPIRTRDEYWSSDRPSSLRREDDLAPFKRGTDIVVNATAYAPGGRPAREWLAGISVGRWTKRVLVTGPRVFAYAPLVGWALGPAAAVLDVPIRYERAFGGRMERDGSVDVHDENPVGMGFVGRRRVRVDGARVIPAPEILSADGRLPVLGEPYPVEGLSAIARSWQRRLSAAGTFDAAWRAERSPRLPRDFDAAFYNCAHPDLIADSSLRGGEEVRLFRLHPVYEVVTFRLPELVVAAAITDQDGYRCGSPARLDTVVIDAEAMRAYLTWRAALPLHTKSIARLDIAMRESLAATMAKVRAGHEGVRWSRSRGA